MDANNTKDTNNFGPNKTWKDTKKYYKIKDPTKLENTLRNITKQRPNNTWKDTKNITKQRPNKTWKYNKKYYKIKNQQNLKIQ